VATKKKIVTPEDEQIISTPEEHGLDALVWMKKIKTSSSGPLGDFNKGGIYQVPFKVYLEFHKHDEAILVEDQ
jgi:hypothetical protein